MNKPKYLSQVILDISKTLMYEFWYDYLKSKYGDKVKLCYMDTDSFVIYVETEDFYKDIAMLINGATQVIMMKMMKDHYPSEKIKN